MNTHYKKIDAKSDNITNNIMNNISLSINMSKIIINILSMEIKIKIIYPSLTLIILLY